MHIYIYIPFFKFFFSFPLSMYIVVVVVVVVVSRKSEIQTSIMLNSEPELSYYFVQVIGYEFG